MTNPLPRPVQELLELFGEELDGLRFPELDASVLVAAERDVAASATRVTEAEAALTTAREALAAAQEAILAKAQRALAYLRIYAEDHPELAARLERIALPRGARRATRPESYDDDAATPTTPRRRGRRPRDASGPLLAFAAAADDAGSVRVAPAE